MDNRQIEPIYQLKNEKTNKKCHELSLGCRLLLLSWIFLFDKIVL